MSPWLVRFPHTREPVVVMDFSGRDPLPGQEVIAGWLIDREAPAGPEAEGLYEREVWVQPIAA